ncbi:trypsin beta-like [Drosophila ficusphila]|uniref:trypsin beta-like n=1 Tax=Drosophila ficusphila TaxID=30025 RepID=UPI001C88F1FF|nr:trypsin beta-like [Drosophila ficusphila]
MFIKCFLLLSAINLLSAGRVLQPEERIIGGKDIEIEDAPWQVSLQKMGEHYCGGSIYSKDIIVTAAHCRFNETGVKLEAEHLQVRVGSSLKDRDGILIKVKAIISHENYNNLTIANDIAVMRLSESLEFSSKVQPIPLAERNPLPGSLAMTSGWGAVKLKHSFTSPNKELIIEEHRERLKSTLLPIQNCREDDDTHEDNICVNSKGQSTCSGDSGGPLVVDQQLVGVTSFGPPYCDDFSAFASVPYFRNWIFNATKFI